MRFAVSIGSLCLLTLQACSVHPVQQDVTGIPTAVLADHIRCEAVTAIEDKAIQLLRTYNKNGSVALADWLDEDRARFRRFDPAKLDGKERAFYDRYINSAIAFAFTFDITEDNKGGGGVDLLKPFTGGTFALGLGASGEFSRNNSRRFSISDTFEALLHSDTLQCSDAPTATNYAYPISGKIGLGEVIGTFVDLNEDGRDLQFLDKAQVLADTLAFITTIGVSANPKITYVAGGKGFQVMDAPFTTGSSRVDKHQVVIGLSLASKTKDNSSKKLRGDSSIGVIFPGAQLLTSDNGTAVQRANQAIRDQKVDTYLERGIP